MWLRGFGFLVSSRRVCGCGLWVLPRAAVRMGAQSGRGFGSNVDAADPQEDTAGGQSEEAIAAASGGRVMVDWNDITGVMFPPTTRAGSGTGVGYSTDGGKHFTDLVGLPNPNPDQTWSGDPGVVAIDGGAHYILSSLYMPSNQACITGTKPAVGTVALSVATPTVHGMAFTRPILVANPGNLCTLFSSGTPPLNVALLDKDWISWDQSSRTLVVSYSRIFLNRGTGAGQIEIKRVHVPAGFDSFSAVNVSAPGARLTRFFVPWAARCGAITAQCGAHGRAPGAAHRS